MCGIAGIINFKNTHIETSLINRMLDTIEYRGPDGRGVTKNPEMAFGHVRLSIIDLAGGKQPLSNEDGTIWITFNGEIYNYKDLRAMLINKGHQFRTNSDTETLVHLYEDYREKMLEHLQGMFAFAIWDKNKREAFIARDRIGIKPLYYYQDQESFIFASESKAILSNNQVPKNLDFDGLNNYFTYRSTPAPGTLYKGIRKLRPGHYLKIKEGGITEKPYWNISTENPVYKDTSILEINKDFESLLIKSINRRLISDVPVGCFLSGGLDSSLIAAIMSKYSTTPIKTYSVGFDNYKHTETSYAQLVAKHCSTEHHELILKETCVIDHLEELTRVRDAPLSEPADIPLYLLSLMARKDVKVVLSGEGADELFAGYPKYVYDRFSPYINTIPISVRNFIANLLPPSCRRVEIALESFGCNENSDRWANWFAPFTLKEKGELNKDFLRWKNPSKKYDSELPNHSNLSKMLYTDCKIWLPENLLDRGDRMTMRASVEGRVPFLDHEIIEFAFNLPDRARIKGFETKSVVKDIARSYLPSTIIDRPKSGFKVPLNEWFQGRLKDYCYDTILANKGITTSYLDRNYVRSILEDHCKKKKDHSLKIWTLLGISIWYKQNFNN